MLLGSGPVRSVRSREGRVTAAPTTHCCGAHILSQMQPLDPSSTLPAHRPGKATRLLPYRTTWEAHFFPEAVKRPFPRKAEQEAENILGFV